MKFRQSFMSQMYLGQSNTDKVQTCETLAGLRLQTRRVLALLWLYLNWQGEEGGLGDGRYYISLVFKLTFHVSMYQVRSSSWESI